MVRSGGRELYAWLTEAPLQECLMHTGEPPAQAETFACTPQTRAWASLAALFQRHLPPWPLLSPNTQGSPIPYDPIPALPHLPSPQPSRTISPVTNPCSPFPSRPLPSPSLTKSQRRPSPPHFPAQPPSYQLQHLEQGQPAISEDRLQELLHPDNAEPLRPNCTVLRLGVRQWTGGRGRPGW